MFIFPNNYHYYIAYLDLIKCLENIHLPETMYLDLILSKLFQEQEVLNRLSRRHCKNLLHLKFLSIFRTEFQLLLHEHKQHIDVHGPNTQTHSIVY